MHNAYLLNTFINKPIYYYARKTSFYRSSVTGQYARKSKRQHVSNITTKIYYDYFTPVDA